MNTIKNTFKKHKIVSIVALLLVLAILYFVFGRAGKKPELYTVNRGDVTQSVTLSGKVQTSDRADLGFASSGRVAKILIKNNQTVKQGAILAQLEIGDLLADLKVKQANVRTSDVDLTSAKSELDKVKTQENAKVESAYRKLLSADLALVPEDDNSTLTPPIVTGIYKGSEGQYKIIIARETSTSDRHEVRTFGLERTTREINEQAATPLGTQGLYISFPVNAISEYRDTTWYLDIPNKAGPTYVNTYNAYNEARKSADLAIQQAQSTYDKLATEGDNGASTSAQAEVEKINAEIRKNTIYAPFTGTVTNIEKEVGENASTGERVISILGESKLEVVLQVSELDVSRIPPGSKIKITLDAFPGETFEGTLKTINSRDTTVQGVPVYEAFVELPTDPRIKTGMSATGTITLAEKASVLAVPSYLIEKNGTENFVTVMTKEGKNEKRIVTLGLTGTDNMVEITSGLEVGDQVLAKATK